MYVIVLPASMPMYHICARCSQRPAVWDGPLRIGAAGGCEALCDVGNQAQVFWKSN